MDINIWNCREIIMKTNVVDDDGYEPNNIRLRVIDDDDKEVCDILLYSFGKLPKLTIDEIQPIDGEGEYESWLLAYPFNPESPIA